MKRATFQILLILVVFCFLVHMILAQKSEVSSDEKREAEKAWEALIRMKGGRENLHLINNMVREMALGNDGFSSVWLLDFPDYAWHFGYNIGEEPSIYLWNGKKAINQFVTGNGPISTEKTLDDSARNAYSLERVVYLLETKWDKPELLRVKQIKNGKAKYEVIEAMVRGQRIDFIYEIEEMIVLEIDLYYKGSVWRKYSFLDYTEINGIKMPQRHGMKQGKYMDKEKYEYYPVRFSFNVQYDSQIFENPQATTPDAWKVKPQNCADGK